MRYEAGEYRKGGVKSVARATYYRIRTFLLRIATFNEYIGTASYGPSLRRSMELGDISILLLREGLDVFFCDLEESMGRPLLAGIVD